MGLSKDDCSELLGIFIGTLHSDFKACPSPESYLARATHSNEASHSDKQNVVLVGASNLGQCAKYLTDAGMRLTNLAKPGWFASRDNITTATAEVRKMTVYGERVKTQEEKLPHILSNKRRRQRGRGRERHP